MRKIQSANDVFDLISPWRLENDDTKKEILIFLKEDDEVLGIIDKTDIEAYIGIPMLAKANAVVFVTNHPEGSSIPTKDDIENTKKIKDLLSVVNIGLLDHIIIGYKEFYSYEMEKNTFTIKA